MSEVSNSFKNVDMEQECSCLFCGNSFKVKEIVFAKNESNSSSSPQDEIFAKAMDEYKLIEGEVAVEAPRRRFFTWTKEDINSTEPGPNGTLIPKSVNGRIPKDQMNATRRRSIFATDEDAVESENETEKEVRLISSVRLCPHCHMSLPDGFAVEEVRRIGLVGGSRCGKTTYMVVVCKYMENYLGILGGGLELGEVTFLNECSVYLNKMYDSQSKKAEGASATVLDSDSIKEKPVFPIIAHIVPINEMYKPFYIIIQDIPGEYMLPENRDILINSAIPKSTDLISLVDINSLTWTRMQKDEKYGAFCKLAPGELFQNFSGLGDELQKFHKLQTIQLCLTKLDFWLEANPEVGQGTVLGRNGNEEHRGSISDRRLSDISNQVDYRLQDVGKKDMSTLIDVMLRNLHLGNETIHTAYTAVASRVVPGNDKDFENTGIDYSTSLNVMEPLLNIFSWADLLPHDKNEREITGKEPEENLNVDSQPKKSFFKRLFHMN